MTRLRTPFAISLVLFAFSITAAQGQAATPAWFQDSLVGFLENPRVLGMGWSRDGKWAALSPIDTGARGGRAVRLLAIDAIEDTILFDTAIWSDEVEQRAEGTDALAEVMAESAAWRDFLALHGKLKVARPVEGEQEVRPFPLKLQGAKIGVRVDSAIVEESGPNESKTIDYRLVAESDLKGQKIFSSGRVNQAYEVVVDGCSLSPFEPRMVVCFSIYRAGFEGDRSQTYGFSGCRLDAGFTRK